MAILTEICRRTRRLQVVPGTFPLSNFDRGGGCPITRVREAQRHEAQRHEDQRHCHRCRAAETAWQCSASEWAVLLVRSSKNLSLELLLRAPSKLHSWKIDQIKDHQVHSCRCPSSYAEHICRSLLRVALLFSRAGPAR
jgi:hypothetical protein